MIPIPQRAPSNSQGYYAHVREADGAIQLLEDHLRESASICSLFASHIGLRQCGRLVGLLHDIGKYSAAFQRYIRDVTGLNGEEAKAAGESMQGKIDHATAGAQIIWDAYKAKIIPCYVAQVLSVAIMSHHSRSGMKDFIDLSGRSPFLIRMSRASVDTFKEEVIEKAAPEIMEEVRGLLESPGLVAEFKLAINHINNNFNELIPRQNTFSLLTRFLFSCLLDADRINTSDFEKARSAGFRSIGQSPNWAALVNRLEAELAGLSHETEINGIRSRISDECRAAATRPQNLFILQVPTGGGKTLASLRFALHRAASSNTHQVDRIIYVLPYTSILDQNAEVARKILGDDVVLEHHANLSEEKNTWRNRVLSENWDSPVVFTTSVQFLNALFAAGTKTARRMHQLSRSIVIFDEIQSLPIKTIHLFNNAINFLCQQCDTTAVLCTATMPLLQAVEPKLGALLMPETPSIIVDKITLFKKLKRVTIVDDCRPNGWSNAEIVDYARDLQKRSQSLLVICNTKKSAHDLFELLKINTTIPVVHLSTNMCPVHRRHRISQIHSKLDPQNPQPVICISTQLIEAGVDLDFGCVIRSLAGLDSIVQAAGRCNRHGHRKMGFVHILNFNQEELYSSLKEIELGQEITRNRIFQEFRDDPSSFDHDLLSEKAMNRYYEYYFYQRSREMEYHCSAGKGNPPLLQSCSILSLLSSNERSVSEAVRTKNRPAWDLPFKQAHSTASQAFTVIDAPTQGIVVPYDHDGHRGSKIIADLAASYTCAEVSLADRVRLHKQAQQYTVNAFPHVVRSLASQEAIREIQLGEGIYYLDERYYHEDLGVTLEALSEQHFLHT